VHKALHDNYCLTCIRQGAAEAETEIPRGFEWSSGNVEDMWVAQFKYKTTHKKKKKNFNNEASWTRCLCDEN